MEKEIVAHFGVGPHLRTGSIFIPEVILLDQLGSSRKLSPEYMLAWAVLEDAVRSLLSGPILRAEAKVKRRRDLQRENDREWLNSNDDLPFSFVWVCDALRVSHENARRVITQLINSTREQAPDSQRTCPGCGRSFTPPLSKPDQVFCLALCAGQEGRGDSSINWNRSGLCACGCGNKTPPAKYTSLRLGWLIGKPTWYMPGHGKYKIRGEKRHGKKIFEKLDQT